MDRRALLALVGTIAVTGVAGCSEQLSGSPGTDGGTTSSTSVQTTSTATTQTPRPTTQFRPDASVLVQNRTDTEQTVAVTITAPVQDDVVFEQSVTVAAGAMQTVSDAFVEPDSRAEYVANVRLGDSTEATHQFGVGKGSGFGYLSITVEENGDITIFGTYA